MSCTRQKNKNNKEKPITVDLNVCALCLGSENDVEQYGRFFRCNKQKLAVHEYCLFFASGLAQNGEDHEGFDGFLHHDIVEEIKRASKLRCTLCHAKGAAIGCSVSKCASSFHFRCGLEKNALFQFFGSFRSFCKRHRPTQKRLLSYTEPIQSPVCPVCLSEVDRSDSIESLKSPCCKNAWFHRSCIQKQALANGMYFFRCAFCNNCDEFQEEMKQMGIYIPHRDAIWEEGDAYAELLHQYNRCDAATCLCPKGREYTGKHNNKRWRIYRCFACGQSGTHRWCQDSKMRRQYLCPNCVICFPTSEKTANNEQNDKLASTTCENRPSDDSQSITDCPQNNETTQELNSSSTDLEENVPLSQLIEHFKTKMNTDKEVIVPPNDSGHACTNKDPFEHFDGLDNYASSDSSSHVDVEALSSDSSFTLSKDSSITKIENSNTDCCMDKRKSRKRKGVCGPKSFKAKPHGRNTKAERRFTREMYAKRRQVREIHEKLNQANASSSDACITKDDNLDPATNNTVCLTPKKDGFGDNSEANSLNQNPGLPLLSLDKGCSETLSFEVSSNESLNEYFGVNPIKKDSETNKSDGGTLTANNKTGLSLEKEFQIDASSMSFKSTVSSISSGKNKLLQRDIRGMLIFKNKNKVHSTAKSSVKLVDNRGCQIMPMKRHCGNKRRKLSVNSSSSECNSITTFMSTCDSSPERKSPKRKLATRESPSHILNEEDEKKVESTVSHSIIETMTAAKGMMMQALSRLNSSSQQNDKSLIDIDSDSTESWKSGPSRINNEKDSASASNVVRKKSLEDSDSDSTDSIKVVKVKKGRGQKSRLIPLIAKKCSVPSTAHARHCECYMANVPKVLFSNPTKRAEATCDVIVIDDENDEQDSGKGSSRETSDVGMKTCDGSGAEEEENLTKKNKDFSLHYSSFEDGDNVQFDYYDHDKTNSQKTISKLDTCEGGTSNVDDSKSEVTNSNSVSQESKRTSNGVFQSERVSRKSRANGKKQVDQLDAVPSILSLEALENPYFADNSIDECNRDNALESLDSMSDTFSENNFKGNFKKKEKSSNSNIKGVQGQHGSELNLPSSRKIKAQEGQKKSTLSLKMYMECSDEDFQGKKKIATKAKKSRADIRTGMNNKDRKKKLLKKKLLKKKKLGTQEVERFNNSSSAVVSNISIAS